MSNYTMSASGVSPITVTDMAGIDLSFGENKKLPNKKISFDIHTAHGGYVVRVTRGYGNEDEMYVISDDKDLGNELGKIVTHYTISKE